MRQRLFLAGVFVFFLATHTAFAAHRENAGVKSAEADVKSLFSSDWSKLNAYRIFTGDDGNSHIESYKFPGEQGDIFGNPKAIYSYFTFKAKSVGLISAPAQINGSAHNTNGERELVHILFGSNTFTFRDGSSKTLHAGDLVLIEDKTGTGHGGHSGKEGYAAMLVSVE